MKSELTLNLLLALAIAVLPGCRERSEAEEKRKEEPDSKVATELREAGEHLKEAGRATGEKVTVAAKEFGDLLTERWDEARAGAFDLRGKLVEAYERNLTEARKQLQRWSEGADDESREVREILARRIEEAEERLTELRKATSESWEAAQRAFNVAWEELRDAVEKARAEFARRAQKDPDE